MLEATSFTERSGSWSTGRRLTPSRSGTGGRPHRSTSVGYRSTSLAMAEVGTPGRATPGPAMTSGTRVADSRRVDLPKCPWSPRWKPLSPATTTTVRSNRWACASASSTAPIWASAKVAAARYAAMASGHFSRGMSAPPAVQGGHVGAPGKRGRRLVVEAKVALGHDHGACGFRMPSTRKTGCDRGDVMMRTALRAATSSGSGVPVAGHAPHSSPSTSSGSFPYVSTASDQWNPLSKRLWYALPTRAV